MVGGAMLGCLEQTDSQIGASRAFDPKVKMPSSYPSYPNFEDDAVLSNT